MAQARPYEPRTVLQDFPIPSADDTGSIPERIPDPPQRTTSGGNREKISAVASSVGYSSIDYYNRMFRRYMGCTSSEYKRRKRDG